MITSSQASGPGFRSTASNIMQKLPVINIGLAGPVIPMSGIVAATDNLNHLYCSCVAKA